MARTDHSFPAGSGSPAAAPAALRGRGAVTNVRHRFQKDDRVQVDDGWSTSGLPADFVDAVPNTSVIPILPDVRRAPASPKTTVTAEEARKILSRNDSPDIPFDAVSYTHLDVYKRQRLYVLRISPATCLMEESFRGAAQAATETFFQPAARRGGRSIP